MMQPAGARKKATTQAEKREEALAAAGAAGAPLFTLAPLTKAAASPSGAAAGPARSSGSVIRIEFSIDKAGTSHYQGVGFAQTTINLAAYGGNSPVGWMMISDGRKGNKSNWQSYAQSPYTSRWKAGDVIAVTYDKSNGDVHWFKNDHDLGKAYTLDPGMEVYPIATLNNPDDQVTITSGNYGFTRGGSNGTWEFSGTNNCTAKQTRSQSSGTTAIAELEVETASGGGVGLAVQYTDASNFQEFVELRRSGESPGAISKAV